MTNETITCSSTFRLEAIDEGREVTESQNLEEREVTQSQNLEKINISNRNLFGSKELPLRKLDEGYRDSSQHSSLKLFVDDSCHMQSGPSMYIQDKPSSLSYFEDIIAAELSQDPLYYLNMHNFEDFHFRTNDDELLLSCQSTPQQGGQSRLAPNSGTIITVTAFITVSGDFKG